ncbi:hypothetical protein BJ875DRAFT_373693, partial [Amylocarpus encephaloides]
LKYNSINIYGLISSYPAIYLAATKVFRGKYIKVLYYRIIEASPIGYIKDTKLCGSIFSSSNTNDLISYINLGFFINYTKLLKALV